MTPAIRLLLLLAVPKVNVTPLPPPGSAVRITKNNANNATRVTTTLSGSKRRITA